MTEQSSGIVRARPLRPMDRALAPPPQGWAGPTPNSVVFRLVELSRMLDEATDEIDRLDEAWVQAKQAHSVAFAKAFLTSTERSVDARKQDAVLQCADLHLASEIAEQLVRSAKERIKTLRDQIEIGRSLGAAARAEWVATNWTQP